MNGMNWRILKVKIERESSRCGQSLGRRRVGLAELAVGRLSTGRQPRSAIVGYWERPLLCLLDGLCGLLMSFNERAKGSGASYEDQMIEVVD